MNVKINAKYATFTCLNDSPTKIKYTQQNPSCVMRRNVFTSKLYQNEEKHIINIIRPYRPL